MLAWAPEWGWTLTCSAPGKRRERPLLGERLGDVDELAAAVVALAGQALGVLVREPAALGLHHGGGGVVLAGDQLDLVVLAAALALHRRPELGVEVGDRASAVRAWSVIPIARSSIWPASARRRTDPGRAIGARLACRAIFPRRRPRDGRRAAVRPATGVGSPTARAEHASTSPRGDRARPAGSAADRPCSRRRSRRARRGPVRRRGRSPTASPELRRRSPPRRGPAAGPTGSPTSSAAARPPRRAPAARRGPGPAARSSGAPPVSSGGRVAPGAAATTTVRPPGQNAPASAAAAGGHSPIARRLVRVGEEQHDRPVRRAGRLAANSASIPPGVSSATRDPVDRVRRQGDDPAGPEDARSPRPGRRRRPGRPGRSRRRPASARRRAAAASAAAAVPGGIRGSARTSCSIRSATPSSASGRREVPGGRPDRRRRVRHRGAVADRGDHLEVVELVADREHVRQRHAGPAREPRGRRRPSTRPGRGTRGSAGG